MDRPVALVLIVGSLLWMGWFPVVLIVRDIRTRRWDRAADRRDLDNLREQVRLQCEWDAAHPAKPVDWYGDRDWALIQGAIYGADFQRWEREVAS